MNRNSLTDLSARAMHHAVRMGITGGINDNPMWQELNFGGLSGDLGRLVERVQAFGFSSVPLPPIVKKAMAAAGGAAGKSGEPGVATLASEGGGGGAGGGAGGGEAQEAEGIAVFLGGQRNHPVIISVDDRRHRPMGLKPGENAQYDDAQQMTLMRRNGLYLLSNDNEDGEGKKADRMVSLRHVEKKKQERKPQQPQQSAQQIARMTPRVRRDYMRAMAQQAKDDQAKQDFKHEGDTVNTELRVTKKKIEFRNGDEVVAEHDKQSKKWDIKGKQVAVTPEDSHTVSTKQVTIGHQNVNINGSTAVAITGPTTVNGDGVATLQMFIPRDALIAALEARVAALEARLDRMPGA